MISLQLSQALHEPWATLDGIFVDSDLHANTCADDVDTTGVGGAAVFCDEYAFFSMK